METTSIKNKETDFWYFIRLIMAKIKVSKKEYHDIWRDEMRKYAEGKQSFAEMNRRANRYTT